MGKERRRAETRRAARVFSFPSCTWERSVATKLKLRSSRLGGPEDATAVAIGPRRGWRPRCRWATWGTSTRSPASPPFSRTRSRCAPPAGCRQLNLVKNESTELASYLLDAGEGRRRACRRGRPVFARSHPGREGTLALRAGRLCFVPPAPCRRRGDRLDLTHPPVSVIGRGRELRRVGHASSGLMYRLDDRQRGP